MKSVYSEVCTVHTPHVPVTVRAVQRDACGWGGPGNGMVMQLETCFLGEWVEV